MRRQSPYNSNGRQCAFLRKLYELSIQSLNYVPPINRLVLEKRGVVRGKDWAFAALSEGEGEKLTIWVDSQEEGRRYFAFERDGMVERKGQKAKFKKTVLKSKDN